MVQPQQKRKLLGEMLMEEGLLTRVQLDNALAEQRKHGGRLGAILKNLGYVTDQDIIKVLGKQMGIQHQSLSSVVIDQDAVKLIPETLARRHQTIPIFKKDKVLTVAMVDPLNVFAIDDLKQTTGLEIQPVVSTESDVLKAIDRFYSVTSSVEEVLKGMEDYRVGPERRSGQERRGEVDRRLGEGSEEGPYWIDPQGQSIPLARRLSTVSPSTGGVVGGDETTLELQRVAEDAPIIKLVNIIIAQAVREGASDIHVEPEEEVLRVRYRVDGMMHEVMSPPRNLHTGVASRIKIMADLDIAERRIPQDGRIRMRVGEKVIDIRLSTLPTVYGEKIVMRLLDKQSVLFGLEELGFDPDNLVKFKQMIRRPYGLILVTGPTGSGKTTTLYAALNGIHSVEKNIVTIEDPVEYQLKGVNQVQVNLKVGVTFATGLRSILRQDPDIIMIGEIRDRETATIAVQAALTGHLVFSTLHTNDAPGAIARLVDIGVESFLMTSSLSGVVAQRLVRKVCSHCKKSYNPEAGLLKELGLHGKKLTFVRGEGCQECRGSGYSGRVAIFELLTLDESIRHLIVSRASASQIRNKARETGFKQLRHDGLLKAVSGLTTLEEVIRVTQEIEE
jgi:type IV pilus assembly protein PilB